MERYYNFPESAAACKCFAERIQIVSQVGRVKGNEIETGLTFSRERCSVQMLRGVDPYRQSSARSLVERQCNKERTYIPEGVTAYKYFSSRRSQVNVDRRRGADYRAGWNSFGYGVDNGCW